MDKLLEKIYKNERWETEVLFPTEGAVDLRKSNGEIVIVVERTDYVDAPVADRGTWWAHGYDRTGQRRVVSGYGSTPSGAYHRMQIKGSALTKETV